MKKILFFAVATIILSSCADKKSPTNNIDQAAQNEIVISNDMENAKGIIPSWHNERTIIAMKEISAHSGEFACVTNDTMEYSYSFSELFSNLNKGVPKMAVVSGWIYTTIANPKQGLVLDIKEGDSLYEWKGYPLDDILKETGKWVEFNASFYFSKPLKPEQKVSIFFWNQSKKPIFIDDMKISFLY